MVVPPDDPGEEPTFRSGPGSVPPSESESELASGRGSGADDDGPSRRIRWFGGCLLAALLVPGLLGLELWPLTGWKMFSLPRADTGTAWVLEGVNESGDTRLVDLEELPVAFSNAEWQLREVDAASDIRREEICQALAVAVAAADPTIVELRIARDDRRLVEEDGGWGVEHDLDVRYMCVPDGDDMGVDGL